MKKSSHQVEVTVASGDNKFSASLQANVLDNIAGDTPAFEWSTLKTNWSHLQSIPFQKVAKRKQIDVLIGSDNPICHRILQEVHGSKTNYPIARKTCLGWVCFGPTQTKEFRRSSKSHFTRTYRTNQIEKVIERCSTPVLGTGIHRHSRRKLESLDARRRCGSGPSNRNTMFQNRQIRNRHSLDER